MYYPFGINRSARVLVSTVTFALAFSSNNAVSVGPTVTIDNVPLPVTGTVGVSSLPAVSVSSLPPVSLAPPAQPFHGSMTLDSSDPLKAVGVTGQRLAVTTLTITNTSTSQAVQPVRLFIPQISGGSCSGVVTEIVEPATIVLVESLRTLQLQFPTPRVFGLGGLGCIGAWATGTLGVGTLIVDVVGHAVP